MNQDEFIKQLRVELNNSQLMFNEHNVCRLIIDNSTIIDLEWLENNILYFYAEIGHSQHLSKEELIILLEANAFGQGVGKASIAIDNQQVLLQQSLSTLELSFVAFIDELEPFITHAIGWKNQLLIS
ncbi:type III secretion system chaperone [uncultured Shewanella sp.]|uniref:type III secretion system chaperone n=1 Tax=uncultured Shewanella sp. TaxID=173975 RepID=UPI0026016A09|nr:type III secretion system chaperone [uncultured Shewanella sp.]